MGKHQMPARGARDGLRQDMQKAKDGTGYAPNGVGNAYSHNFLNQKPWHPANFRNQAKVYEAEQKQIEEAKRKEISKAEFEAEQEFLKTLSYLSPEEQQRFRERQGVQFLYMKPPGADSLPAPAAAANAPAKPEEGGPSSAVRTDAPQQLNARPQTSYLGNMLGAMRALQTHEKWHVAHVAGAGRSPPRGNAESAAANQQILVTSSEEEADADIDQAGSTGRRQKHSRDQLAEAEAVLRQAGYDMSKFRSSQKRKAKSHKKTKHERSKKRHKDKG